MRVNTSIEVLLFLIGFVLGAGIFFSFFSPHSMRPKHRDINFKKFKYDLKLADTLFDEIKILCLVLTQPKDHKTKAMHVKNTWGKKCNKLIFLSSEYDSNLGAIRLPYNESRDILWGKVKHGFEIAYQDYFEEFDWFLKGDDDSYFVMENLRHFLYQYNPQTSLLIGHKYSINNVKDGYTAGGGYVLSKKALEKLIKMSIPNGKCYLSDGGAEDLEMGKCLQNLALIIDGHNEKSEKEFFSIDLTYHLNENVDTKFWYFINLWFNVTQGNLSCCSDTFTNMHYVNPMKMHFLDYLIYNVHPFGISNNYSNKLPRKLTFDEIVTASEAKSNSPNYVEHEILHHFDDDEKF